ncbi:MAG: myo-inositol-1(or 4)-monophosphatase [Arenicella sp.]|jgi:myo-inositol-1(or 4)-monophosphatase
MIVNHNNLGYANQMKSKSQVQDTNREIAALAVKAAKMAGALIQKGAKDISLLNIEQKTLHDYVSEIDRNSEAAIFDLVSQRFPEHAFIGEEFGSLGGQQGEYTWIVDPLDGTTNFLRGIPHYAVSIAVAVGKQIHHAVIFDPAKNDLFTASLGAGSLLNGKPIQVSNCQGVRGGLLATGIPFSGQLLEDLDCFTTTMQGMLAHHTSGIRRLGSAALDLAYVAAGRYDGYWEASLKPWDIAAGVLIVQEAGGRVADFVGDEDYLQTGNIVAASPGLMDDMIKITSACYKGASD